MKIAVVAPRKWQWWAWGPRSQRILCWVTAVLWASPQPSTFFRRCVSFTKQRLWEKSFFFFYCFPFQRTALSEDTRMLPLWMAQFPFLFPKRGGLCLSYDSARVIHFQVIKKLVYWKRLPAQVAKPVQARRIVNKGSYVSNAINRGHLKTLHDCRHLII